MVERKNINRRGWRNTAALFLAVLLAVLNPLLCVVHCQLHAAAALQQARALFICMHPDDRPAAPDTDSPVPLPLPRAAYEGVLTLMMLGGAIIVLPRRIFPRALLCRSQTCRRPPLPPPRLVAG